jgi:hypothetical protein
MTCQPASTSPMRRASGTRAPSRKTSLKAAPPVSCRMGRTSIPGWSMSMRNTVSPRLVREAGSVRASSMPTLL